MKLKSKNTKIILGVVSIIAIVIIGFYYLNSNESMSITKKTDVIFDDTGGYNTLEFVAGEDMGDLEITVSVIGSGDDTIVRFIWEADVQFPPVTGSYNDDYLGYIYVPALDGYGVWDEHVGILSPTGSTGWTNDGGQHVWIYQMDWTQNDCHITTWFDGVIPTIEAAPDDAPMKTLDYWMSEGIQYIIDFDPVYYEYMSQYLDHLGWKEWADGDCDIYSELGYYDYDDETSTSIWTAIWTTPQILLQKEGNVFTIS